MLMVQLVIFDLVNDRDSHIFVVDASVHADLCRPNGVIYMELILSGSDACF